MAVVTAKQLVAAVAGQCDRHLLAGEAAHQVRWDLRRICERLVIHRGKQWNDVACFRGRDIMLMMDGAEVPRDGFGILRLVVSGRLETDRIASHGNRRML